MGKVFRYIQESRFCWRTGQTFGDKWRLWTQTLRFHLGNYGRSSANQKNTPPAHYSLRYGNGTWDLWLRTHRGDLFVFYEVLLDEIYRLPKLPPDTVRTVVDLGANVGLSTIYFASRFPHARFVCVEPDPENFVLLQQNLASLGNRVHLLKGAVAEASGVGALQTGGASWQSSLSAPGDDGVKVRLYSMPEIVEICNLQRIDILKMDIEGSEKHVLKDASAWLDRLNLMLIELHGDYGLSDFSAYMQRHNFKIFEPYSELGNRTLAAVRAT